VNSIYVVVILGCSAFKSFHGLCALTPQVRCSHTMLITAAANEACENACYLSGVTYTSMIDLIISDFIHHTPAVTTNILHRASRGSITRTIHAAAITYYAIQHYSVSSKCCPQIIFFSGGFAQDSDQLCLSGLN
jgi:hypothetical protein